MAAAFYLMRGSVVAKAHLKCDSTVSLFLTLFFISANVEKPASHYHYSLVNKNASKLELLCLPLCDTKQTADQYAGKTFFSKEILHRRPSHFFDVFIELSKQSCVNIELSILSG